jgi:hypothetical protein
MDLEWKNMRHKTRHKTDFSIEVQTRFTRNTEVTALPPSFDYWNMKI